MVKCVMCGEDATKVISINNLYGVSDVKEIYLCEDCLSEIENVIEDRIKEDSPKFTL